MGRLRVELVERVESLCHRVVDVAEVLQREKRSERIVNQLIGSGTSVGANVAEADEALSRADFCKCIGIALKELAETRFWLRFAERRGWVGTGRLGALLDETREIKLVLGSILTKSRRPPTARV